MNENQTFQDAMHYMKPTELAQLYVLAQRYPDLIKATTDQIGDKLDYLVGLEAAAAEIKKARNYHR